ncbi:SRPBCC domain-containing protein [Chitinophaga japonensis]|uniref:Uncharacterized protein YndB with AHSA1/START domain n=1 Tax=Chitinophaga japonensis TaxID=104662 RepID=A0A562T4K4_CHIJA|nr:SRPBCC domain-containing protein [Chitinophaga japonensis]TWI88303.1 uncharacterized protein YndB with AHSA1/START domain [Chitinophaga japonensis]
MTDQKRTPAEEPVASSGMLIYKPVEEVFEALVNPDITSMFWFSKSSGRLDTGRPVEWTWEAYHVSTTVTPVEIIPNQSITFRWVAGDLETTVYITFTSKSADVTFVSVDEKGWKADDPNLVQHIAGQTEGWVLVLVSMKAYLEHGWRIKAVEARFPEGYEN